MPVVNTIELEGVSSVSWGDAAREALREAGRSIRNIYKMDVLSTSARITDQGISEYRTQVRLFFNIEGR